MRILFFHASWCCQCHALEPLLKKECERLNFENLTSIDADSPEGESMCPQFGVRSLPTLIFLDKGKVIGRASGVEAWKEVEKHVKP